MGWRAFVALVGARVRGGRNAVWRGSRLRRTVIFFVLAAGALGWLLLFELTRRGTGRLLAWLPGAQGTAMTLFEALLLLLLAGLAFSSLLVALTQLFLSADLKLLAALPVSTTTILAVKAAEVGFSATAMPLLFGTPVIAGFGAALGAPPAYYVLSFVCLLLFVSIPASLGLAASTALVNLFPANRARDVLVFLALVMLLGAYLVVRALEPERLANVVELERLAESLSSTRLPASWLLPSGWVASALRPMLTGAAKPAWAPLAWLTSAALASAALAAVAFRALFRRGLSRTVASRARLVTGAGLGASLVASLTRPLPRKVGAIVGKDLLVFARDTSQWSQLLLLGSLIIIYLLPIRDLSVAGLETRRGAHLLVFLSVVLAGFVLAAVASRFLFAAVSLEGRNVWVPLSSPMRARTLVLAKVVAGVPLLWVYGLPLVLGTWLIVGGSVGVLLVAVAGMTLAAIAIGCLAVGVGAVLPSFRLDNPARVVVSPAGLAFMLLAIVYVAVLAAALAMPTYVVHLASSGDVSAVQWLLAAGSACVAIVATAVAGGLPLWLGIVRLEQYELEA